jgi:hypothetical protein
VPPPVGSAPPPSADAALLLLVGRQLGQHVAEVGAAACPPPLLLPLSCTVPVRSVR